MEHGTVSIEQWHRLRADHLKAREREEKWKVALVQALNGEREAKAQRDALLTALKNLAAAVMEGRSFFIEDSLQDARAAIALVEGDPPCPF